jgi:hypothetical protein
MVEDTSVSTYQLSVAWKRTSTYLMTRLRTLQTQGFASPDTVDDIKDHLDKITVGVQSISTQVNRIESQR